jgi:hypothetical protein
MQDDEADRLDTAWGLTARSRLGPQLRAGRRRDSAREVRRIGEVNREVDGCRGHCHRTRREVS